MELVEIPSQLSELDVEDFGDTTAGLQRGDQPQPPKPVVLHERSEAFFFTWLEPAFAFELTKLRRP